MANVVKIDEVFSTEQIGKALAKLLDVNGLSGRLEPLCFECPISLEPISSNAAMIGDGGVYQMGYIQNWLQSNSRSPLTNVELPHCKILRVSPITALVESFLHECRDRREHSRAQRVLAAKQIDRTCNGQLQQKLQELEV